MKNKFKHKHMISLADLSKEDILLIMKIAREIKRKLKKGVKFQPLQGKNLAMIFQKPSTRTRVSFEVGMDQLGGHALFLTNAETQLGRGETVQDTARVLSRFVDAIVIRTFDQQDVVNLAAHATVPVINGLTDLEHPCQVLADLLTIMEKKQSISKLKVCFVGDGNNVANSWAQLAAKMGFSFTLACPEGYECPDEVWKKALKAALKSKAVLKAGHHASEAVKGCDVIITDTWTSMGQEAEEQARVRDFDGFQVNDQLVKKAKSDCLVMHCLPAHRGQEITSSVLDGKHSVVWDEAENRLHVQKAVMVLLMAKKR